MPLPETIPVRYTDEEAGYVTVRPIVRQTFKLEELLDMLLSVAGKDLMRIRQLLRTGTVVYHFFRYSWTGIDADETELAAALARFPDAEPSRPFSPEDCTVALFESGGANPRHLMDLSRSDGSKRRIFRSRSFWDQLLEIAASEKVRYERYSYGRRGDIYCLDLDGENKELITEAGKRFAPRSLQPVIQVVFRSASILFVCPRSGNATSH
jgi:hypothetical protein